MSAAAAGGTRFWHVRAPAFIPLECAGALPTCHSAGYLSETDCCCRCAVTHDADANLHARDVKRNDLNWFLTKRNIARTSTQSTLAINFGQFQNKIHVFLQFQLSDNETGKMTSKKWHYDTVILSNPAYKLYFRNNTWAFSSLRCQEHLRRPVLMSQPSSIQSVMGKKIRRFPTEIMVVLLAIF